MYCINRVSLWNCVSSVFLGSLALLPILNDYTYDALHSNLIKSLNSFLSTTAYMFFEKRSCIISLACLLCSVLCELYVMRSSGVIWRYNHWTSLFICGYWHKYLFDVSYVRSYLDIYLTGLYVFVCVHALFN